jgi:hypothetical protein
MAQDPPFDPAASKVDEQETLNTAFQDHVDAFRHERDLSFGMVSLLALRTSLTARMMDYVTWVEKPSSSGLKRELDRFFRDVEGGVRAAKKGADEFIAAFKQAELEAGDPPE